MGSPQWLVWRERWLGAWIRIHGSEPTCLACGRPWSLRHDDLHHRSYDHLGHEGFCDLIPLCRACHNWVHRILESTPAWRRMDRAQATDVIVARLRRAARSEAER